jgi:RsiW-degrading membrane proteinase PrsW (M82 family)
MFCPKCGMAHDAGVAFCARCGTALVEAPTPAPQTAAALPTAADQHWAVPDPVSTLLPHAAPHRRRAFWWALLLGAVVMTVWGGLTSVLPWPPATVPFMLFGAFFVPVLFVFFMASEGLTEEPPTVLLIEVFVGAALFGTLLAVVVESILPFGPWEAGPVEEAVKFLAVVWLLRRRQYVSIMDGILFGAAAGMGFAAVENLGYFFNNYTATGLLAALTALQNGQIHSFVDAQYVFNHVGLSNLVSIFLLRSFLGPWGHGAWTAIIAGVAWREAAAGKMRLDRRFFGTFILIAAIHSLWDLTTGLGAISYVIFAGIVVVDVYLLRSLILAAHRQERGEPVEVPAPPHPRRLPRAGHFCTNCGARLIGEARFCARCGREMGAGPAAPVVAAVGVEAEPQST